MLSDPKTGTPVPITSKSVFATHDTLGHKRAPGGKGTSQGNHIRKKSNKMGLQVSSSALHPKDSRAFYDSIYIKSIGYVLPNITMHVSVSTECHH
jgi:hypothetical protein